jgi:hypothetical protein
MTTLSLNNRNDDLIELNKESFSKAPFNFNIPSKNNRANPNNFRNDDILFNKNKISSDVLSMSSRSSSRASSVDGDRKNYMKSLKKHHYREETDDSESLASEGSSISVKKTSKPQSQSQVYHQYSKKPIDTRSVSNHSEDSESGSGSSDSGSNESGSDKSGSYETGSEYSENSQVIKRKKSLDPREQLMNELNEKREILYQLDRLESKGFKIPFKFNMNSDLEEMRHEYNRIVREKELDASVRFQQKMMMAFVSGVEYLNNRYDPFAVKLDGWSEQINENINDYDDIFEELHQKYKSSGKKMAPELRLLVSLSGSAFMFHLTSRMFKEQPLPNVENVLKSDPELMKQFQNAAAKQYIMGNNGMAQQGFSQPKQSDGGMGLFSMVSNLFGSLSGPSMPSQLSQPSYQSEMKPKSVEDVDNIIKNVHSNISIDHNDNNIETLSVSDEEITSIIEDTADIRILRNPKSRANTRTLNL